MKRLTFMFLVIIGFSSYCCNVFGQTAEEIPMPVIEVEPSPDTSTTPSEELSTQTPSVSSPETMVQEQTPSETVETPPVFSPVAEPQPQPVTPVSPSFAVQQTPEEDNTLKGVTLSPSIALFPLGYDSINLGGPEGERFFLSIKPTMDISTAFKTSKDTKVDFSAYYYLNWREYYNKDTTTRDFEQEVSGTVGIGLTDVVSTSFTGLFNYFFKSGDDTDFNNSLVVDASAALKFAFSKKWSLKTSYFAEFVNVFDKKLSFDSVNTMTDPPTDLDELSRGSLISSGTAERNYNYYDPYDIFSDYYSPTSSDQQSWWFNTHGLIINGSFAPVDGTKIGLTTQYNFAGFSNDDTQEWKELFIVPSFSQNMPWKGGSISISNQLRFRTYDYAKTPAGTTKNTFRFRANFEINQAMNDYVTFNMFYRLQFAGSNNDDYESWGKNHLFYAGIIFGF